MDRGIISKLKIRCISLEYTDEEKRIVKELDYQDEIKFIIKHQKRNEWILDMAFSQPKNTMVLFNFVENHGEKLYEQAKKKAEFHNKKLYYIVGEVGADERETIRQAMEKHDNIILFASFGTLSMGINIKNLHSLIFCHPYKARIRTLQSIGRSLRKLENKDHAILLDISDNLCYGKFQNTTFQHFIKRLKLYESEGFDTTFETHRLT